MVHYCLVWSLKLMWLKPFKHQSPFRTSQIWTWTDVDKLLDRRTFSPRCTPPPSHPTPPPPEGSDHPPGRPSALGWTGSVFPRGTWPTACCWRPGSRGSGWRGHWGVCPEVTPQFHSQTLLQQQPWEEHLIILQLPVRQPTLLLLHLCRPRSSSPRSPSSSPSAHWGAAWLCAEDPADLISTFNIGGGPVRTG